MSDYITEASLGYSVYGQKQLCYTVDGVAGHTYGEAISMAALKRATGVEAMLQASTLIVRARQTKLSELGKALSIFSKVAAQFKPDDGTGTSKSDGDLPTAYAICVKYGVDTFGASGSSIRKDQIQQVQTSVQYSIDMENTDMQQDLVQLQTFVDKRDSALAFANTLLKKVNNTFSTGIRNIN